MAHYVNSQIKEFIDKETGEVIVQEMSKSWTKKVNAENFFFTFIDAFSGIQTRISSDIDRRVLDWLVCHAEYNTGKIYLPAQTREELCVSTKLPPSALSRSLTNLKKLGLIIGERGVYIVNPEIFWKGDQVVRRKILENGNLKFTISIETDDENASN